MGNEIEFKINEYLSLKLESNKTNIYVNGRLFKTCKFLLIQIPLSEINTLDEIESIDEASDKLSHSLEGDHNLQGIPSKTLFWGHCSNLQAWTENDYNSRLLHRNLAFPLLRKLAEVGDTLAKSVFKEEVAKRFLSNYEPVKEFLITEGYFETFTKEELEVIGVQHHIELVKAVNKCNSLLDNNRIEEAIRVCHNILEIAPDNLKVLYNLGLVFKDKGEYEKALGLFHKCNRLDPNEHNVMTSIGEVYDLLGEYDLSLFYAEKAINLFPETFEAYYYQGNAYFYEGEYEDAISAYIVAFDSRMREGFSPLDNKIWEKLAQAYFNVGDYEEALYACKIFFRTLSKNRIHNKELIRNLRKKIKEKLEENVIFENSKL